MVDPAAGPATTAGAGAGSRTVWRPVAVLVAVMWVVALLDLLVPWDAPDSGVVSRTWTGLLAVPLMPFLHADLAHLVANTVPLVVLGLLVSWRAGRAFWPVVATVAIGSGLGVWLVGASDTVTIGASGLVFGLLAYLLTAGLLTRHWVDVLVAALVLVLYGGVLGGALPFGVPAGVSWLAHLCGLVAGVVAAVLFVDRPRGG